MAHQIDQLVSTCKAAAAVGAKVVTSARAGFTIREKAPADFVTAVDLASQNAITNYIADRHPTHRLVSEEAATANIEFDGYCWLIDPLDGTTNFIHGLPHYAVSVAVAVDTIPIVGCVIDPVRGEQFWAAAGAGAWLNDQKITTSETCSLDAALVAVSLAAQVDIDSIDVSRVLTALRNCRAVRRLGSASLNLAYIAAGRLDAYWARSLKPWDVAAGILLIQEAGGIVSRIDGGALALGDPQLCTAATESLHASVLRMLGEPL